MEASFLSEGGEGVVHVQLAAPVAGPQRAEGRGRAGDIDVMLVVGWLVGRRVGLRMRGWVGGRLGLLEGLVLRRGVAWGPGPRRSTSVGGRCPVFCCGIVQRRSRVVNLRACVGIRLTIIN